MSDASDPCIAPPGNLCTDTGCWDADRCVVYPAPAECPSGCGRNEPCPNRWHDDQRIEGQGWAAYAAEQERHAETAARLERLRDGVAHLHDVYAVAPNQPRCCSDCAANDISAELRRLLRDA